MTDTGPGSFLALTVHLNSERGDFSGVTEMTLTQLILNRLWIGSSHYGSGEG